MKRLFCIIFMIGALSCSKAQTVEISPRDVVVSVIGASIASKSANVWPSIAGEKLGTVVLNKAVSGTTARAFVREQQETTFNNFFIENTDILLIMYTHNFTVLDKNNPYDVNTDGGALNKLISDYKKLCADLQYNQQSKYYNVKGGKPALIYICTHWHDGRWVYANICREIAKFQNIKVLNFENCTSFTGPEPVVNNIHFSTKYSPDMELIGKVKYGWHIHNSIESPAQQGIANICYEVLKPVVDSIKLANSKPLF